MSSNQYCFIDFETFGSADLKKVGAWQYASHPKTGIHCIGYLAPYSEHPGLVKRYQLHETHQMTKDMKRAQTLYRLAADPKVMFVAHNAEFEQAIWAEIMVKRYGYPEIPPERWIDTMALAFYYALPGSLEGVAKALQLKNQKDTGAKKNMLKLAKPRRQTKTNSKEFWAPEDAPEDFEILYEYCLQDIRTLVDVFNTLPPMSALERQMWIEDQRINQRGLYIDVEACEKACEFIAIEKEQLLAKFAAATNTEIKPTQRAKMKDWFEGKGLLLPNTQKTTLQAIADYEDIDDATRAAIELMASANKASLAKYPAMVARSNAMGWLRGAFAYCGAKRTKRWAGRGVQFQNLPRPVFDSDLVIERLTRYDHDMFSNLYDVNAALSTGLRGMVIAPPNCDLFVADFEQFENRIAAWLAGCEWKLNNFRNGIDPYKLSASSIFGVAPDGVNDEQRFVGKVGELSLQYQGGIKAYAKMSKQYGLNLLKVYRLIVGSADQDELDRADFCYRMYIDAHVKSKTIERPVSREVGFVANIIKERWRAKHPEIVNTWDDYFMAACYATLSENGEVFSAGTGKATVRYFKHTIGSSPFLVCKLPCGTCLFYFRPKCEIGERGKFNLTYWGDKGRESTYGGKLFENVVQGVQRMAMRDALLAVAAEFDIRLHVHDEIIVSVPEGEGDLNRFIELMTRPRKWSEEIPIGAKGDRMKRYAKK